MFLDWKIKEIVLVILVIETDSVKYQLHSTHIAYYMLTLNVPYSLICTTGPSLFFRFPGRSYLLKNDF